MLSFNKIYTYNKGEPIYSVIVPIYNQEGIIVENIKSIIDNTLGAFEIILILDYCFDNTEKYIIDFFDGYSNNKAELIQVKIFKNSNIPLFETKCDNIGFKSSSGIYCLEIQADMKMTEMGYNLQLTKPFHILDNVIAVSGRCAHNLYNGYGIGKLGEDVEQTVEQLNIERNLFYVFDTCNRGPLLIHRAKLEELGFLDEENYFLDDSDHDLMIRAYLSKGYICGYVPIDFHAPLQLGSTRNTNTYDRCNEYLVNKAELERLKNIFASKEGIQKYKDRWVNREPACYRLPHA
jgi:glycosyltransferase involved in cell wall biosynthesis